MASNHSNKRFRDNDHDTDSESNNERFSDSNSNSWSRQALNKLSVDFCQNLWCKMMEKMINARSCGPLRRRVSFSEKQCGFRKNRSMLDHVVRFETFITNAFVKK